MNTDKTILSYPYPSDNRMVPGKVGRTPWSAPDPLVGLPARRVFVLCGWPDPAMRGSSVFIRG